LLIKAVRNIVASRSGKRTKMLVVFGVFEFTAKYAWNSFYEFVFRISIINNSKYKYEDIRIVYLPTILFGYCELASALSF
jgi:hypothetical protein